MRRLAAALTVTALLLLALPVFATGDYENPCDEYHETRHPECTTTTTYQTTTTPPTTTTSEVTTTQPEVTTTTSETTTTGQQETTTTTAAPCAPGLIHQPPLCVNPSTTVPVTSADTTAAPPTTLLESLPFTGSSTGPLALSALALALLGGAMIRKGRTA